MTTARAPGGYQRKTTRQTHRHAKSQTRLDAAIAILSARHPMTLRQVYYQLVSRQIIENNVSQYTVLSRLLRDARLAGDIPWDWMEDRLRRPRTVSMWAGLGDFATAAAQSYRRDVWADQPTGRYVEVWLEKDALSGIFEKVLRPYGVTLNVGRGFDGWSSIKDASDRLDDGSTVLYFGDFDPSGEDMVRSLTERLDTLSASPQIIKCALTRGDITTYGLPHDPTKATDSRSRAFVAKHGDMAVELDALPPDVLEDRLRAEVEACMDMDALEETRQREDDERLRLVEMLSDARDDA